MSELISIGHGPQAQIHSEPEPEVHKMELELEPVQTKIAATQTDDLSCW